jgi:hypothetical protein
MAIALTNPSATKQLLISMASSLVSVQVENSGLPARMLHEPGVARAGLPVHVMAHRQTMLQCGRDWFLRNNTLQNIEDMRSGQVICIKSTLDNPGTESDQMLSAASITR